MPIMCVVQLPKGKKPEQIQAAMQDLSNVLISDFGVEPKQVRVTIEELPRGRYIAGGVMDYEMPDFNGEEDTDKAAEGTSEKEEGNSAENKTPKEG